MASRRITLASWLSVLSFGCGGATVGHTDATPDIAHDVVADAPDVTAVPDVAPDEAAAPDVPLTMQPLGAPCTADDQCTSGVCVTLPGLGLGCAQPCQQDEDCTTPGFQCALDREPSVTRFVCNGVTVVDNLAGTACVLDTDCISVDCVGGLCAAPCTTNAPCVPGTQCVPQVFSNGTVHSCGWPAITGPTVDDFVVFNGTYHVDSPVQFTIAAPPDMVSMTFTSQDLVGTGLFASIPLLVAPDGTNWIDSTTWNGIADQPVRTLIGLPQINTALAPSNDTLHIVPGLYQADFALYNDPMSGVHVATRMGSATVRIKRAPGGVLPATGTVHLRVFLVGISIDAATAPTNSRYMAGLAQMQSIYGTVGMNVVVDSYTDITGTDATTYSTLDSEAELDELLTLGGTTPNDSIDLFLISNISASAGLEGAIGVAGAIVGPPGMHGTTHSGVVVGWDSTHGSGFDVLGETMAHECGHYLGLWHTFEHDPPCTTTVTDTCSLFGGVDPITDTPTAPSAASTYVMSWVTDGTNLTMSPGEGIVMRSNTIVQ